MHEWIDGKAQEWIEHMPQEDWPYGRFIYLWIAFNQLYNFHCYDMHPNCSLERQLAMDLKPRAIGSPRDTSVTNCPFKQGGNKTDVQEWTRIVCVARYLPVRVQQELLDSEEARYFATRAAYSIVTGEWDASECGVLDVHRTRNNSNPFYTLGFVDAWKQYRSGDADPSNAVQHLARLLYTIRCNLVHGGKRYRQENNIKVVSQAIPLVEGIVTTLIDIPSEALASEI